jgi:hypothetical protein
LPDIYVQFNWHEDNEGDGPTLTRKVATELHAKGFTYKRQIKTCFVYIALCILAGISMESIIAKNKCIQEFLKTYEEGV